MNTRILETLEFSKIKNGFEPYLQTEMGLVELNQLSPLSQVTKIQQAFSEIEDMASIFVEQHHFAIGHTRDITDTLRRLELSGDLNISEMIDLKRVLTVTSELGRFYQTLDNVQLSELKRLFEALEAFPNLQGALQAVNDAGFIEDFASPELSSIRRQINTNEHHIRQTLQDILKKNSDYLVEQLVANRNGRSVLPVKNSYRNRLSGVVHDISSSGNTVYIEPRAIISLNEENTQLKADERHEIKRILKELSQMIAPHTLAIRNNLWIIGHLDLIRAKYFYMTEKKGSIPKLASDKTIQLLGARHPLLSNPIPNDLHFPDALTAIVITGPNTGGKTIMLKTLGVTQLMGQSGLPILADKGSKIAVFSEIFADIGDEQSIEQSLSTFSSHMTHTVDILKTANQDSLILFDELGAGTDPQEGASLAISILDFLRNAKIKTMATTHYPELKAYGIETPNVENASMAFDINTLSPTYHFMQGVPGRSNAFEIAKRLGLFESIVTAAEQLTDRDSDVNSLIEKLENQTLESKIRLNHIKEVEQENIKFNRAVKKLYNEFSHAKDKEIEKATKEAREIVELALKESDSILKNLHTRAAVKPHEIIEAKGQLKKLIPDTSLSQNKVLKRAKKHRQPLVGDDIIVIAYGQRGTLIKSLKERTWEAQVGLIKMTLSEDEFQLVKTSENKSKVSQKSLPVIKKSGPSSPRARLDLRGMRYEEAISELDSFIDQALVNNLSQVDIIHGIGTGVIREAVTKYLRQHRHVKNFAYAPQNAGGSGCTIATLK